MIVALILLELAIGIVLLAFALAWLISNAIEFFERLMDDVE